MMDRDDDDSEMYIIYLEGGIAELKAKNAALRSVVDAAEKLMYYRRGHDVIIDDSLFDPFEEALDALTPVARQGQAGQTRP